jgi:hypothetical protein
MQACAYAGSMGSKRVIGIRQGTKKQGCECFREMFGIMHGIVGTAVYEGYKKWENRDLTVGTVVHRTGDMI